MGTKKMMNVPVAVEHQFEKGDKIIFFKEVDYIEEKKKFRNNK